MQHIENDECTVITRQLFEHRRAQDTILKDAWAAQLRPEDTFIPRGPISTFSEDNQTENGGVSIIDNDISTAMHAHTGKEQQDCLTPSLNLLALRDQYPTLPPFVAATKQGQLIDHEIHSDSNSPATSSPSWNVSAPAAGRLFDSVKSPPPSNGSPKGQNRDCHAADKIGRPQPAPSKDFNAHVKTRTAPIRLAPVLDPMNCFQPLTNKFECPGQNCGESFDSIEAFNDHLTSPNHAGGPTVCPSCLRRFGSTMALVAHCESPSKRCIIRRSSNYDQLLRDITGGLIGTSGHHIDGSVRYIAKDISKSGNFR